MFYLRPRLTRVPGLGPISKALKREQAALWELYKNPPDDIDDRKKQFAAAMRRIRRARREKSPLPSVLWHLV